MRLHGHRWAITGATAATERASDAATVEAAATVVLRRCTRPGCSATSTEMLPGRWTLQDLDTGRHP